MERYNPPRAIAVSIPRQDDLLHSLVAHLPQTRIWTENAAYFALVAILWAAVMYWAIVSAVS